MPATAEEQETRQDAGRQARAAVAVDFAAASKAVQAAIQNRCPTPTQPVSTTRFTAPLLAADHNSPGSPNANEGAEPADPSSSTPHHHILLDPGLKLEIGEHSYIHDSRILNPSGALTGIRIGKFCSIATELTIIGYDHHSEWISTYPFLDDGNRERWSGTEGIPYPQAARFGSNKSRGDISIGHDVWIGYGVKLFKGVTIGDGAVIGACSLVNKSVEPYTVVAGIPARPIRKRFSDGEIAFLQEIRWWDWPEALINRHMIFLCSSKAGEFERLLRDDPYFQKWVRDGRPTSRPAQAANASVPNPRRMIEEVRHQKEKANHAVEKLFGPGAKRVAPPTIVPAPIFVRNGKVSSTVGTSAAAQAETSVANTAPYDTNLAAAQPAYNELIPALDDPASLEKQFEVLGPWFTQFTINGRPYGGKYSYDNDPRLRDFFEWCTEGESVLELGSFEGAHSFALTSAPRIRKHLGLEGRQYLINRAEFMKKALGNDRVSFKQCNFEVDPINHYGLHDMVFCSGLLYHIAEPWKLVEQIARVTNRFFLATHYAEKRLVQRDRYWGTLWQEGTYADPLSGLVNKSFWPTFPHLVAMLTDYGFRVVHVRDYPEWTTAPLASLYCEKIETQLNPRMIESLICEEIAPDDEMFQGNRAHYFGVGESASHCIQSALGAANKPALEIQSILDLPCGHGRVMRFLKAAFPHAPLTACDLNRDAVDFCARTFGAEPVYSDIDVSRVPLRRKFDLIWCGSLLTHLRAEPCAELVRWLSSLLNLNALLIFTVHGRWVERWLATGRYKYGLPDERISALLKNYYNSGFGYADYPGQTNYGISVCSPAFVLDKFVSLADLKLVAYHEKGWDNHQDVVCLQKQGPAEFLG